MAKTRLKAIRVCPQLRVGMTSLPEKSQPITTKKNAGCLGKTQDYLRQDVLRGAASGKVD